MGQKPRDSIVFLNEQMKHAGEVLTEWERGRLFEALRAYSIDGVLPDLTGETKLYCSIFNMMRSAQDKAIGRYEEICERNKKNALKRSQRETEKDYLISQWQQQSVAANATSGSHCYQWQPPQPVVATATSGSQSNLIESNLIKSNLIESNQVAAEHDDDLNGREVEGVPGVVWVR